MAKTSKPIDVKTEQGRQLASKLYDYRLNKLLRLSPQERAQLLGEFPELGEAEFDYVLEQTIAAKRQEQVLVGWQTVPHDVAVLVLVTITVLFNLQVGIVAGVAVLVLLESLFQFYFNQRLYRYLSYLVWLTYPAYGVLAYVLSIRGYEPLWVVGIVILVWAGTFLLGILARLPVRMILEARQGKK